MFSRVRKFLIGDDGPTAVEYAILLSLVVMVAAASVQALGGSTESSFSGGAKALSGDGSGSGSGNGSANSDSSGGSGSAGGGSAPSGGSGGGKGKGKGRK